MPAKEHHIRFVIMAMLFATLMALVIGRVVYLQLFNTAFLQKQGDLRTLRVASVPAHRGMILDRHDSPLAVSAPVFSIWANPQLLAAEPQQLKSLAKALDVSYKTLAARLDKYQEKSFVYLKRQVSPTIKDKVLALSLTGVFSKVEHRRYYPGGEVTGHLLGFTNIDDIGQEGVELAFNKTLQGKPGKKRVLKDRLGRIVANLESIAPAEPGQDLRLSIDKRIQYVAYRELKSAVTRHEAESGSAVMIDVETGELLALVNQPTFNPNDRTQRKSQVYRNRALTDVFEPGSTAKPFAILSALSTKDYRPTTLVNTAPGWVTIAGYTIRDAKNYGTIDLSTVIQKSSNVGMSKIALSMAPKILWKSFADVGFGQVSDVGLPGEATGYLPNFSEWYPVEQATLSYGYGLSVNTLQLAQSYAILGARGIKRPLTLQKGIVSPGERVISRANAKHVLQMLEKVVAPGGTGTKARVMGYTVAGKTGTTRKVGESGYTDDEYYAIFVGLAPAHDPKLALAVVIDNPKGAEYYGGQVAAPVFSNIMQESLYLLNVAPVGNDSSPLQIAKHVDTHS